MELFVDNFAGGGGASTGIEMAIGRSVDIAINHDAAAIAMHKANHPTTKHYCENIFEVSPKEACGDNTVALAWFSPDCRHFSRAKGGKPVEKNIRGLAWVTIRWAYEVRPRVIMLENVPEIQTWGPLNEDGKPIKERMGETFNGFLAILSKMGLSKTHPAFIEMCEALQIDIDSQTADELSKGLGYDIEYDELVSADFGAPTTRKRFYMIARCDGKSIMWPIPTHARKDSALVKNGKRKPWRPVAECIDFSIPTKSIFERDKPLAENTLRRIARGIKKFVIDNPEPFIVNVNHGGDCFRGQTLNEPLHTVTAKHGFGLVMPTIMCNNTGNIGASADAPLPTVTTGNRNYLVESKVAPADNSFIVNYKFDNEPKSCKEPLTTITSINNHYLVAPTLIQYHSEQSEKEVRGQKVDEPIMTIDTAPRYALSVAHIMKNYSGGYKGAGSAVDAPLGTVTAKDHNSLVTAHIMTMRNNMVGQKIDEPLSTISCSGAHHAEVQAFLIKYFSNGTAKSIEEPLDTITTKDRFAMVTIHGQDYIITDIRMRMLQPRELFNAQGFPKEYIIDRDADGNEYKKVKQVARCGNAVTPPVPAALVRANLPEYCNKKVETKKSTKIINLYSANEQIRKF